MTQENERSITEFGETIPREMYDPKPGELGLVRALGFNNWLGGPDGGNEEMFFIGPSGDRADHCNETAAREFIAHYERAIETMKLYLLNGRNRKTHEWTVKEAAPKNANAMVRGLVRAAELREREGGGNLWDDESRAALKEARARGWGKGHTGSLLELPVGERSGK